MAVIIPASACGRVGLKSVSKLSKYAVGSSNRTTSDYVVGSRRLLHSAPVSPATSPRPLADDVEPKFAVRGPVPGPNSKRLKEALLQVQQMDTVILFADFDQSRGNHLVDADGNTYLDAYMHIASLPLGYNHPAILSALSDKRNLSMLANRPSMAWFPNKEWAAQVQDMFMSAAPKGMDQIFPMMCGTCSNENAIKLAFMRYMNKKRGGRTEFTREELDSAIQHKEPGSTKLSILSFKGGFHGRTIGLLSCSSSKGIHGVDIPVMSWPTANFPRYKYPLEDNAEENRREDARCLASVEEQIERQTNVGVPVAGVIVEPIQAEAGDHHGSKEFFQGLEAICKANDISLIIDEVQTGGGSTGKMWCHEHFGIEADIVTFAKKMISGGIFHKSSHRPPQPARILNTWLGDPHKALLLGATLRTIREQNLLDLAVRAGDVLLKGLKEIELRHGSILHTARGLGTFCAIDCPDPKTRDNLVKKVLEKGVVIGGCGESTIRFRPALIFEPRHAEIVLDKLDSAASSINEKRKP